MSTPMSPGGMAPPPQHSGAVTAVAIVNFLVGAIIILIGVGFIVAGGTIVNFLFSIGQEAARQAGTEEAKKAAEVGGWLVNFIVGSLSIAGFCCATTGVPEIFAGIGVMNRRQWGRVLCIILSIFYAVATVVWAISLVWPFVILYGFYAIFNMAVLFNPRYAAEFRSGPG